MDTQKNVDFVIKYTGDMYELQRSILYAILRKPTKEDMPVIVLATGKSGRGKSRGTIEIQDQLYNMEGVDFSQYVKDVNVLNPAHYALKLKPILYDKKYKKVWTFQIDEARAVIGAENWHSFINTAIAHVNATSRAIKPLCIFIVTQSIKDVDAATRRTLDYWFKFTRTPYTPPRLTPYVFYMDEDNPERPELKKRRLKGYIIDENGKYNLVFPVFQLNMPREEVDKPYREVMQESKTDYLDNLLEKLVNKISKDLGDKQTKQVDELENFFRNDPQQFNTWCEFKKGKWKIKSSMYSKLGMKKEQIDLLEKRFNVVEVAANAALFPEAGLNATTE